MDLASFNTADDDEVTTALRACNAAAPFAPAVASGRPYESVEALVGWAGEVSRALPWADVAQALAAHPGSATGCPGSRPRRRRPAASRPR